MLVEQEPGPQIIILQPDKFKKHKKTNPCKEFIVDLINIVLPIAIIIGVIVGGIILASFLI
jgi:hypothetical protein